MGDSYTVDTAVLRTVAGTMRGHASGTQSALDRAAGTDVPEHAWGLVGSDLGLPERYDQVRAQAQRSLAGIRQFLERSAETLGQTASAYDEQEETVAATFRSIGGDHR